MAFEKNNWKSGDVISATKLNAMEDGIVEGSEPVTWADVTEKPATFAPATHSHDWAEITGKPTTFAPETHSHAWEDVTGKPTTFAPETHTHTIANVTGLQAKIDDLESRLSALETPAG